ncbi:MAG: hypothetical protein DI635_05300 [Pseudoxanthomonas suwonensis]|nr:MAG: hypothetical protein DI635_05300 [Pseudoxanthomonas suwonensis]
MAGKRVLLVEGKNDEHVVKNICGRLNLGQIDEIRPKSGKDPLLDVLPVELKGASDGSVSVMGVILDADENLQSRWQSVCGRLVEAGYQNVPDVPAEDGTILLPPAGSKPLPRFGIWVMPDNRVPGILEDFLKFLVPDGDVVLAHAEQSLDNLPDKRFRSLDRPKALMHTWLAWQEEPGKPYGQAITARYLDTDLPMGKSFSAWLEKVFFDE